MWSKDDSIAVVFGCSSGVVVGTVSTSAGVGTTLGNVLTAITAIAASLGWYVIRG